MTTFEFLKDKKIVILGFGRQGRATFQYIRKHFPNKQIKNLVNYRKPGEINI